MGILKKKHQVLLIIMLLCLLFTSSCEKKGASKDSQGNGKDYPEDTPWNHGPLAILENETGWYTWGLNDGVGIICLRYYDKESANTILLCNKPECAHEGGDGCEATYQSLKVINAVFYDGYLYILGWDGIDDGMGHYTSDVNKKYNVINLSLYRAALDGSAIDKVGMVLETENEQHLSVKKRSFGDYAYYYNDNSFIIHKGFAYIPYYLQLGSGLVGLRGGGMIKMDLSTGKTQEIDKIENLQKRAPAGLVGTEDYVYYYQVDGTVRKDYPWYRYVISEDRIESAEPKFSDPEATFSGRKHEILPIAPYFKGDRSYWLAKSYQEGEEDRIAIVVCNVTTGEVLPEESIETQVPFNKKKYRSSHRYPSQYSMTYYNGMFLIADEDKATLCDQNGVILGEIAVPKEMFEIAEAETGLTMEYRISNEKLYLIFGRMGFNYANYRILSSSLEYIKNGQGKWTDAFYVQGIKTLEKLLEEQSQFEQPVLPK